MPAWRRGHVRLILGHAIVCALATTAFSLVVETRARTRGAPERSLCPSPQDIEMHHRSPPARCREEDERDSRCLFGEVPFC